MRRATRRSTEAPRLTTNVGNPYYGLQLSAGCATDTLHPGPVREYLHRLVLWYARGPPGLDLAAFRREQAPHLQAPQPQAPQLQAPQPQAQQVLGECAFKDKVCMHGCENTTCVYWAHMTWGDKLANFPDPCRSPVLRAKRNRTQP